MVEGVREDRQGDERREGDDHGEEENPPALLPLRVDHGEREAGGQDEQDRDHPVPAPDRDLLQHVLENDREQQCRRDPDPGRVRSQQGEDVECRD